jgi:hypothetical protein
VAAKISFIEKIYFAFGDCANISDYSLLSGMKMYQPLNSPDTALELLHHAPSLILFIFGGFIGYLLKGAYSSTCRWIVESFIPSIAQKYRWDWFGNYFEGFMETVFSRAESFRNSGLDPSEQIILLLCQTVEIIYGPFVGFLLEDLPNIIHNFFILLACLGSTPMKNYGRVWKIFEGRKIKLLFNLSRSIVA